MGYCLFPSRVAGTCIAHAERSGRGGLLRSRASQLAAGSAGVAVSLSDSEVSTTVVAITGRPASGSSQLCHNHDACLPSHPVVALPLCFYNTKTERPH